MRSVAYKALISARLLMTILILLPIQATAQCTSKVLVSDYSGNNVRAYDGCDGSYLADLDNHGRLAGPQALRLGPDGLVYVASEENARIVRYDPETLAFVDIFIADTGSIERPTGMDFGPDGDLFVAGFDSNNIGRFDGASGAFEGIFASAGGSFDGPDAGMSFGPDGHLYVPAFNSSNVVKINGETGAFISEFAAAGSAGLSQSRVVLFSPDGQRVLISSYGSNRIVEYSIDGRLIGQLGGRIASPTGIAFHPDGDLLVTTDLVDQITRHDPDDGTVLSELVSRNTSPLQAGTFLLALGEAAPLAQDSNEQFWIVGVGSINDQSIIVDEAVSAVAGRFGDGLDPDAVQRPLWGRIQVEFTGCDRAELSWEAEDGIFGNGGYALQRLAPTPAQAACEAIGFDAVADLNWVVGSWYGGATRSGEGLLIDVLDGGLAFLAWFTFTP